MSETTTSSTVRINYREPVLWTVVFSNDDFTPMIFVVHILVIVFNKSIDEANAVMLTIHNEGMARVGRYTKEVAFHKVDHVMALAYMNQHPLQVYPETI